MSSRYRSSESRQSFLSAAAGLWSKGGGEVNFDELAGESEAANAQQDACSAERRSDDRDGELVPGCAQNRGVLADDVNDRTDDLIGAGADRSRQMVTGSRRSGSTISRRNAPSTKQPSRLIKGCLACGMEEQGLG